MSIESFRDLRVWKESVALAKIIYYLTKKLPKDELYGLTSQMRRACVSIVSNIAEGQARQSIREYIRHLSFALGSNAELHAQIILLYELELLKQEDTSKAEQCCIKTAKMLRRLKQSLESVANRDIHNLLPITHNPFAESP
jgi:four helix bundle protein